MAEANPKTDTATIEISYQKSGSFRTIHVDGIIGGLSPRGTINISAFSERTALPTASKLDVVAGVPGAETITATRSGVVRELEVNMVMDVGAALSLLGWLRNQLVTFKAQSGMAEDAWTTMVKASGAQI